MGDVQPFAEDFLIAGQNDLFVGWYGARGAAQGGVACLGPSSIQHLTSAQ